MRVLEVLIKQLEHPSGIINRTSECAIINIRTWFIQVITNSRIPMAAVPEFKNDRIFCYFHGVRLLLAYFTKVIMHSYSVLVLHVEPYL